MQIRTQSPPDGVQVNVCVLEMVGGLVPVITGEEGTNFFEARANCGIVIPARLPSRISSVKNGIVNDIGFWNTGELIEEVVDIFGI